MPKGILPDMNNLHPKGTRDQLILIYIREVLFGTSPLGIKIENHGSNIEIAHIERIILNVLSPRLHHVAH